MQDEIVSRLANALSVQLVAVEARRAERSQYPDALDLVFQGSACLYRGLTPENTAEARGFFERALALDPGSVDAWVGVAVVEAAVGGTFFSDNPSTHLALAETAAIKALSLAPNNAVAHLLLGTVQVATKRAARGIAECEQALLLDRNLAFAHGAIGWAKYLLGRGAETEANVLEALRLSPLDTFAFRWLIYVGTAKLHINADAEAVIWLRRGIEANRTFALGYFYLAAALALLGELDEARETAAAGLALNRSFTIKRYRAGKQSDNPTYLAGRERIYDGMSIAGVPEE
jgi:tetratricopeptide (TPR) repeat protein